MSRLGYGCLALAMTALIGGLTAPERAQARDCANPQAACGGRVQSSCLSKLGAGVIRADEPEPQADECQAQLSGYRECLIEIAKECKALPEPVQGAGAAEPELFEILASLGGIIAEPTTIAEFYNNALVYERRGDTLQARRMYERAIAAGGGALDLHERYVAVLKAQEGLMGAREVYADLARGAPDNLGIQYGAATLAPGSRREQRLRDLLAQEPGFAPAHYGISRLYSEDRLGEQSREDRKAEKASLEAFLDADAEGQVYRWFLEKALVERWREDAERRFAPYRTVSLDTPDVRMNIAVSNDGWLVNFSIAEAARAIRYRVDGGPIVELGQTTYIDQRTGQPMPKTNLTLPIRTETAVLSVWYDDIRGNEQGPFDLPFDARLAFAENAKSTLGLIQNWVSGRVWNVDGDGEDEFLVYFSFLLSNRCGMTSIRYGVASPVPDTEYDFPPCIRHDPVATPSEYDGQPFLGFLTFESKPPLLSVQVTFTDGTQSPVREFRF
ncbi:MAG: hypothetical protein AAFV62_13890 [Pseudomonadota bacterium]